MNAERRSGAALCHPIAVVSVVVLVVNDHLLKRVCPGLLTGKLSDFAGVLLLPLFLHALFELAALHFRGRPPSAAAGDRVLACCAVLTALGFTLAELWLPGETAYRFGLGALQWPFRALAAALHGDAWPALAPVHATADATDLLALPMVLVAFRIGGRGRVRVAPPLSRVIKRATAVTALVAVWTLSVPASAAETQGEYTHDGFYLSFELGVAALWVSSNASISNGFRQPLESSAAGWALPAGALSAGGTLADRSIVLAGRIGYARAKEPAIETLGQRFTIEDFALVAVDIQGVIELYPDPHAGLHFGAGLGVALLRSDYSLGGEQQVGPCVSLGAGHGVWIGRAWSIGAGFRVLAARVDGEHGSTALLAPGSFASVTLH